MDKKWHWIGGAALALLLIGILLPSRAHIQRSVEIDARAEMVFALLNDFNWVAEWSLRTADDPNARIDISGPPRGLEASRSWEGTIVGRGHETITVSEPYSRVETVIVGDSGRESTSVFDITAADTATRLTWTYERTYGFNLAGRYFALFLDGIVGDTMETELARVAGLAETLPSAEFGSLQVDLMFVEAQEIAYRRTSSFPEATAISEAMGDAYFEILNFMDRFGLAEDGAPMSITRTFSGSELIFDAAIPVRNISADTPASAENVNLGATYEGPAIRVRHTGSYNTLGRTHDRIAAYLAAMRLTRNGDAWESYVSDPTRTDESELLTYIYYPVLNE
jgi:effector-binding domain-containing protein